MNYKILEFQLHESLVQLEGMLSLLGAEERVLKEIERAKDLIKTKRYRVAVMGEFKRGKSTLINALLGMKILPTDIKPTTATINRITYGEELRVVLHYKDGRKEEVAPENLEAYVTKLTTKGEAVAASIKEAVISMPTVICQNHVDIIDTPGLNDNAKMTKITIDLLEAVDSVVVPLHARAPLSSTECTFIGQLIKSNQIQNLLFVVSFMDQLDEDDYEYETYMARLKEDIYTRVIEELESKKEEAAVLRKARQLLKDVSIYGISATKALEYFITNDAKTLRKSGFEAFKIGLMNQITAKQVEHAISETLGVIQGMSKEIENQYLLGVERFCQEYQRISNARAELDRGLEVGKNILGTKMSEREETLGKLLRSIYVQKNILFKAYVKALSMIRIDAHTIIEEAICNTTRRQYDYMNTIYNRDLMSQIEDWFKEVYREAKVCKLNNIQVFNKKWSIPEDEKLKAQMNKSYFTSSGLEKMSFAWKISPLPDVYDLTKCDVIDNITHAIDVSLNSYFNKVTDQVEVAKSNLIKEWGKEINEDKRLLEEKFIAKTKEIDARAHTYESNYTVFKENAKQILARSEEITALFYKEKGEN